MKGLEGKTAIVTGGSSGIGQAIAIRLGQEGVNVAVNYVGPPEGAEATKDAIEHGVEICMKQIEAAGSEADPRRGGRLEGGRGRARCSSRCRRVRPVDFLVNNAGIQIARSHTSSTSTAFDRVLAVNLRGVVPLRPAGDPPLLADEPRRRRSSTSRRVHQVIPKPRVPRLLGEQGRDAEPDPHAGARVRRPRHPGQRHRPGCDRHPDQPVVGRRPGEAARWSRATSP